MKILVAGAVLLIAAGLGILAYVESQKTDPYVAFQHSCLSHSGASVVTLTTTTRNLYMGAGARSYTLGCRSPNGTISAKIVSSHQ